MTCGICESNRHTSSICPKRNQPERAVNVDAEEAIISVDLERALRKSRRKKRIEGELSK